MQTAPRLPLLSQGHKKKWSYGSLFFSLFYFVPLFFTKTPDTITVLLMLGGYVAFIVLYVATLHQSMKTLPVYMLSLSVLGYVISVFNPGGAIIFGFLAFIVGYYYSIKQGAAFVGLIVSSLMAIQVWGAQGQGFFILASALNSLVLFVYGVMERKETIHQMKRDEQAAAIETLTTIAERERIGRDLHDVAGHALSSISIKAQLAEKLLEKQRYTQAKQEVKDLAALSSQLLSEIREAISGIKQRPLEQELTSLIKKLSDNGKRVTSALDADLLSTVVPTQETQLALIAREAVTNILRHSDGTHVTVSLSQRNNTLIMGIFDDGKTTKPVEGNGLAGIKERATLIGAEVTFSWGERSGLMLHLPLLG